MRVLAVRTVRFYVRNPELVLAKLFTYIFMGCFMGAHAVRCCGLFCCVRSTAAILAPALRLWVVVELPAWLRLRGRNFTIASG